MTGKPADRIRVRRNPKRGAPTAAGVQQLTVTVLQNGSVIGTSTGMSTDFAHSKASTLTTNTGTVGSFSLKYFVGMRADSFHFDVTRFFQVRHFLAQRFFYRSLRSRPVALCSE